MNDQVASDIFAIYFSNFSAHQIEVGGVVYATVEHAYHSARYSDPKIIAKILATRSPEKAWEIAQKYKHVQKTNFGSEKREIMKDLVRTKIEQHESVRQALLDTGDMLIIKHVVTGPLDNGFWGDGTDGRGENQFGKILMELRQELQSAA